MNTLRTALCLLAASLVSSACVTSSDSSAQRPTQQALDSQWMQPSTVLRTQIEDQLTRLPWTHGAERVEQIRWLAGVGEAAYDQLLPMCLDPRPDVAGSALAALGATGDSRLVEPLHALEWGPLVQLEHGLMLERARTLVRLGDWNELPTLVDGLEADDLWTRAWCSQALYEATKQRFGFQPKGEESERAEAVQRWREWIESRQVEGILPAAVARS